MPHIKSLHISLNIAHSVCRPNYFMSSFTHSLQVFFLPLPTHFTSIVHIPRRWHPIILTLTLKICKPSQSAMPYHINQTLNESKCKDWLFIYWNCKLDCNRWMSLILLRFARLQCLAATHLSSPEVGKGLSWPKPQCTCNAMVTSQAQHSTNEGVLSSNSACSMLMSDDLRLPRRGLEPRLSGFRIVDSTARPLSLPNTQKAAQILIALSMLIPNRWFSSPGTCG